MYRNFFYLFFALALVITACSENKLDKEMNETTINSTEDSLAQPSEVETKLMKPIPVPSKYELLKEVTGDLDKDGIDEKVVVYNTSEEGDAGTVRELRIFKKEGDIWKLWHTSIGAVMSSEAGGMMGDPFDAIEIKKGSIVITNLGGSREKWSYSHQYRYQNDNWELIGATVMYGSPCDYWVDFDYNLSTGKINYKKTIESCESEDAEPVTTTSKESFTKKVKLLPKMDGFDPGSTAVVIPNQDDTCYY